MGISKTICIALMSFAFSNLIFAAEDISESVLTPGARLVEGDPAQNEFMILDKDDHSQISVNGQFLNENDASHPVLSSSTPATPKTVMPKKIEKTYSEFSSSSLAKLTNSLSKTKSLIKTSTVLNSQHKLAEGSLKKKTAVATKKNKHIKNKNTLMQKTNHHDKKKNTLALKTNRNHKLKNTLTELNKKITKLHLTNAKKHSRIALLRKNNRKIRHLSLNKNVFKHKRITVKSNVARKNLRKQLLAALPTNKSTKHVKRHIVSV